MALKINGTVVVDDNRNATFANLGVVEKPTNVSPADLASNVIFPIRLTGSAYLSLYNVSHQFSLFEVSNSNTFATITYTSGNVAANVTNEVSIQLDRDTEYYWRVRYIDSDNVFSEFSDPTSFTTANISIDTPTLEFTSARPPVILIETPTLTTSNFAFTGTVTGVTPVHESTDWQVVRTSNNQIVFERLANTVNLTSIVVPAAILEAGNVEYEFKARHNANIFGSSLLGSNIGNTNSYFGPSTLGESFGGGFYSGTIDIGGGVCYYLIVAPNTTGCVCCSWKTSKTATPGTFSANDGYTNTYGQLDNATYPAGNWTATRTIGGFSDWYLPAVNELSALYTNRGSMPAGEGYCATFYWSSATAYSYMVSGFNFSSGGSQTRINCVAYRVRAIRRLLI